MSKKVSSAAQTPQLKQIVEADLTFVFSDVPMIIGITPKAWDASQKAGLPSNKKDLMASFSAKVVDLLTKKPIPKGNLGMTFFEHDDYGQIAEVWAAPDLEGDGLTVLVCGTEEFEDVNDIIDDLEGLRENTLREHKRVHVN